MRNDLQPIVITTNEADAAGPYDTLSYRFEYRAGAAGDERGISERCVNSLRERQNLPIRVSIAMKAILSSRGGSLTRFTIAQVRRVRRQIS